MSRLSIHRHTRWRFVLVVDDKIIRLDAIRRHIDNATAMLEKLDIEYQKPAATSCGIAATVQLSYVRERIGAVRDCVRC